MRRVRFNGTNVLVYILASGEQPIAGEICFAQDELNWAEKLAGAEQDKEMREIFWNGIFEQKKANVTFSVFQAFPKENAPVVKRPKLPDVPGAGREVAAKYCAEILNRLGQRPTG